jgi:hypothetical protein
MEQRICDEPGCTERATHLWGSHMIAQIVLPDMAYCTRHVPHYGHKCEIAEVCDSMTFRLTTTCQRGES